MFSWSEPLSPDDTDTIARKFIRVSDLDELWAGEMIGVEVEGIRVLLVHTEEGVIQAVQAMCPHQAVPLEDGELCGKALICSAHRWEIDVSTGKGINPGHAEIALYPTKVEDGQVYVSVAGIESKHCKP
jgi:toluene monooxygenase system ferredoxin subunit